ncbi:hypothetical protein Tco_1280398 [Tanacetum coccineum]
MTCSTVKRLTKPLDIPEREFRRLKKAAMRSLQNESLAIAGRNLFDNEASSSNNTGAKLPMPPKTLHEHSRLRNEDPLRHVKHYLSIVDNIQADEVTRDTSRLRFFHFSLKGKVAEWLDRIPPTQIMTWDKLVSRFLDHFFLNDDTSPWGNNKRKEKGEDGLGWIVRSKFEDELANFMLKKKSYSKGIGDILVQHDLAHKTHLFQPRLDQRLTTSSREKPKKKGLRAQNQDYTRTRPSAIHPLPTFQDIQSTFSFQIKEAEKDDEDERLLSIFKQIHINLPFLEAMIHMPKGAKVLKDLLSHKEKLEKVDSSVKLSKECSIIIQRSLPKRKETQEASHCHASSDPCSKERPG